MWGPSRQHQHQRQRRRFPSDQGYLRRAAPASELEWRWVECPVKRRPERWWKSSPLTAWVIPRRGHRVIGQQAAVPVGERCAATSLATWPLGVRVPQGIAARDAHKGIVARDAHKGIAARDAHKGIVARDAHKGIVARDAHKGIAARDAHKGIPQRP
jgi:hypothetical protein